MTRAYTGSDTPRIELRAFDRDGTPVRTFVADAAVLDEIDPDHAPHRIEQRTVTFGPWTAAAADTD